MFRSQVQTIQIQTCEFSVASESELPGLRSLGSKTNPADIARTSTNTVPHLLSFGIAQSFIHGLICAATKNKLTCGLEDRGPRTARRRTVRTRGPRTEDRSSDPKRETTNTLTLLLMGQRTSQSSQVASQRSAEVQATEAKPCSLPMSHTDRPEQRTRGHNL